MNTLRLFRSLPAILLPVLILLAAGCGEREEAQVEPRWSPAYVDSVLRELVPREKHSSTRFKAWLAEQRDAIERDSLDPLFVVEIIKWHRAEISDLANIEGYTTYPLIVRSEFELGLDNVVPLRIAELNKHPRIYLDHFYFPKVGTGIQFSGNLLEKFTTMIEAAGAEFESPESFKQLVIRFMQLANRDPQIALTDLLQWRLFYLADSLAVKQPGTGAVNRLSEDFRAAVLALPTPQNIDSLPEAARLLEHLNKDVPGWDREELPFRIIKSTPSLHQGIYRVQMDFADSYFLKIRRIVFTYDRTSGFKAMVVEIKHGERTRAMAGGAEQQ